MRSKNVSPPYLHVSTRKEKRSWIMRGLQEPLPRMKCDRNSPHGDLPGVSKLTHIGIFQIFESKPGNRLPWYQIFRGVSQCFLVHTRIEFQNILSSFFFYILIYSLFMSNLAEYISVSCTQWHRRDPCTYPAEKCIPRGVPRHRENWHMQSVLSDLVRFLPQKEVFLSLFGDPRVTPVKIKGSLDYAVARRPPTGYLRHCTLY
jgi:hypothetical protein